MLLGRIPDPEIDISAMVSMNFCVNNLENKSDLKTHPITLLTTYSALNKLDNVCRNGEGAIVSQNSVLMYFYSLFSVYSAVHYLSFLYLVLAIFVFILCLASTPIKQWPVQYLFVEAL